MIGYFSLSVPSGLSIYWFTNKVLSTAQQVWLRKLGGAKPVVSEKASGIISAGRAKRSGAQAEQSGERFRQLKEEEKKKNSKALPRMMFRRQLHLIPSLRMTGTMELNRR